MILVNTLIKIPLDVNDRVYMGNQFNASGLQSILPKLKEFDDDLLNIQIHACKETLEADMSAAEGGKALRCRLRRTSISLAADFPAQNARSRILI